MTKLAALMLFALAFLAFALGIALFPPILEAFVLVDGDVGSGATRFGVALVSLVVLACGVAASRAARRLRANTDPRAERQIQFTAIALLLSAFVAGALLEVGTRIAVDPADYLRGDAFWIHRFREAQQSKGDDFQSEFPMNRYDTELGWAPREGFRSEEVNVSSLGARGVREHALPKPAGAKRIVVIGDSFSFGEGVRDADTYPSQLEALLGDTEVVNLGVLGHGTDQQLLRLRSHAFQYQPDLVLLGFFGPNAERNLLTFRDAPKPRFVLGGDGIRLTNTPVPGPEVEWPSPLPLLRGPAFIGSRLARALDRTRFAPRFEITRRILDEIASECEARGVPLLLAFYPDKRLSFFAEPGDTEIIVEEWARERDVEFFSIRPKFAALAHEERIRVFYGHWTPFGNGLVAEGLAQRLAELGFENGSGEAAR